jgi:hypothetical protein
MANVIRRILGINESIQRRGADLRRVATTSSEGRTEVDISMIPQEKLAKLRSFTRAAKIPAVGQKLASSS